MPNKGWIDSNLSEPKKDWVSPLKSLDTLKEDRQTKALEPKPEPLPETPVAVENIPYKSVSSAIDAAAKSLLDASVGIKKSEVNLSKALIGVESIGDKGSQITSKVKDFKEKIDRLYSEMETLSNEMGLYKASLPDENNLQ